VTIYTCTYQIEFTKDISRTLLQSGTLLVAITTFAAQHVLANIISGIALSTSKPFDVGDKIKILSIGGTLVSEGNVIDINLRHTIIKKFDGQCDIIPNSVIDSSVISNTNFMEDVGNFIEVTVSYESDAERACHIMKEVIMHNAYTINGADTVVLVKDLTLTGVLLRVLIQAKNLDNSFTACSQIRLDIMKRFKEENIVIPYNTVIVQPMHHTKQHVKEENR
jgi:small-conductance mechanosensitive channel